MKTQFAIYFTLTLLVFGLGYAVFAVFFKITDDASQVTITSPSTPETEDAVPDTQSLLVKSVSGLVERSGVTHDNWTIVLPGNELFADEKLRTEKNATVQLQADDASKIELAGESEISIQEITNTVHRIKLELGRLNVDYKKSRNRELRIVSDSETGNAKTREGRFIIQKRDGKLSVATEKGEVTLSANDKSVSVGAGKLSYVSSGETPTPPKPIPLSVMLRVAKPARLRQTEKNTTIKGQTDVVAEVRVNDIPAPVDAKGNFQISIPLSNGRNPIEVVATTTYGKAKKQLPGVVVLDASTSSASPTVDSAEVRWGKKKTRRAKTSNVKKNH